MAPRSERDDPFRVIPLANGERHLNEAPVGSSSLYMVSALGDFSPGSSESEPMFCNSRA